MARLRLALFADAAASPREAQQGKAKDGTVEKQLVHVAPLFALEAVAGIGEGDQQAARTGL